MTTLRTGLMLAVPAALFAAVSIQPAVGNASCREPPLKLLWSYPANGDVNVPTNALLWTLSSAWRLPEVRLDGASVPSQTEGAQAVALGTLAPQHDYVLQLDYGQAQPGAADGGTVFEIRFRTGDGPATVPPAIPVTGVQRAEGFGTSTCPDVVAAQDCFDTGQNTLLTFDVADDRAIAWQVQNEVWPARCGKPSLYTASLAPKRCYEVRAIGVGGLRSEPSQYCVEPVDAGANVTPTAPADGPEAPRPARGADAGQPSSDGSTIISPSIASSSESASDGSCSVTSGTGASKMQGWYLLLLATGLVARARARARRAAGR